MRTSFRFSMLPMSLVGVIVLAGCGVGGSDNGAGGDGGGDESVSAEQAAVTAGSSSAGAQTADRIEVAPADLAGFSCARQADGRWKAEGQITNSADEPMIYTVTVVTTRGGSRVVGERIRSFQLKPEQAERFSWPGFYRGAASTCMPHVQREPM
ncbi:MAG TPA: hypothetical protein VFJ14_04400 [Nocardioidaceae bacterium]|nr:hypothetical protein [Nocardioidaceae bacterium]